MQILCAGFSRRFGTSKAGKPYDMTQILVLMPMSDSEGATSKREAVGLETSELDCAQALVQKAKLANLKFPCFLDLDIGHEMRYGQLRSIVVDFKVIDRATGEVSKG